MPLPTPYHPGELEVQSASGQLSSAVANGRSISDRIVPGAWQFLAAQRIAVLGSWDSARNVWATLQPGPSGFMSTLDGQQVRFDTTSAPVDVSDPLWVNLETNGRLSLLAIDLSTRRRLRVNGRVDREAGGSRGRGVFEMVVDQAYGNCPKYIQRRSLHATSWGEPGCARGRSTSLSDVQVALIERSDTLFVATVHPDHGTDVSHRGGRPGFVHIDSPNKLRIPDYAGNSMFNTLGNIHSSGIAGLLFVDFASNLQLQVAGDAAIDWHAEGDDVQRTWTLSVREVRESTLAAGLKWDFVDASPFNP